jgi:hypothetical protein
VLRALKPSCLDRPQELAAIDRKIAHFTRRLRTARVKTALGRYSPAFVAGAIALKSRLRDAARAVRT